MTYFDIVRGYNHIMKGENMKNKFYELSQHLNVITGANGSGKTMLLEQLKQDKSLNAEFIDNCGYELSQQELVKYAESLKEKSKYKQMIVVSNQKEIIAVADNLINL